MDALSGEPLWRYSTSASIRHAAACADGRVHAITITGQLVSLDIADGTLLWSYDLPDPSPFSPDSPCGPIGPSGPSHATRNIASMSVIRRTAPSLLNRLLRHAKV